ncbi:MAG: glycosyltransferase family 4 protein, partial [Bacteroidota bacterium]
WAFGVMGALVADVLSAATESIVMAWKLWRGVPEAPQPRPREDGREHVLVVAFACSPGRGSEPGQGWQLASRLAAHHDVTVLTYSGFRDKIESELRQKPIPGFRVVYHRLPGEHTTHWRDGVDRPPGAREQLHYYAWQVSARRLVRRLHREDPFTLAHHVSFMRYWSPSAAAAADVPFLWGPVGGGESAPEAFYAAFSPEGRRSARLRDRVRRIAHHDPFVRGTAYAADLALATTEQSAAAMRAVGALDVRVARASVALADDEIARLAAIPPPEASGDGGSAVRFAVVGRLLHWKGYDLAFRAFAQASGEMPMAWLDVIGDGPEREHLEALVRSLGIADRVVFHGHVPRDRCLGLIGEADVMVHPSLHDSGGYATLEAMAAGRPVVCLALGGPGLQVDAEVGVAVEAHSPEQVVDDLAHAFSRLAADPGLRRAMGARGRARVADRYRWSALVDDILGHYRALAAPGTPLASADAPTPTPEAALA